MKASPLSLHVPSEQDIAQLSLEEALELSSVGFFHARLFLICGLAFMADSLEVNLLSFLSTCAGAEWNLSNAQQASITGLVFVGMIIGSIFWGPFAERYGRRLTLLSTCTTVTVGSILSSIAPSFTILLISRTIAGFGIGGASVPFDLLAEFTPGPDRGKFLIYMSFFWCFGSMFVTGVAWITLSSVGWRLLALLTALPVIITSVLGFCYLPESPHWLLHKGRTKDAMDIIRHAADVNGIDIPDCVTLSDENSIIDEHQSDAPSSEALFEDLVKTHAARKTMIPLWAIWFIFGLTYYGIILFITRIYSNQDSVSSLSTNECSFDYPVLFLNASSEIVSSILSALLIDPIGRVWSQSVFAVLGGISSILLGLRQSAWASMIVSTAARMSASSSLNAVWVATPELLTTELRTVGHGSCYAFSKFGSFLAPYLVISNLSFPVIGVLLGLLQFIAAYCAHLLPETKGMNLGSSKSYESISSNLNSPGYYILNRSPIPKQLMSPGRTTNGDGDGNGYVSRMSSTVSSIEQYSSGPAGSPSPYLPVENEDHYANHRSPHHQQQQQRQQQQQYATGGSTTAASVDTSSGRKMGGSTFNILFPLASRSSSRYQQVLGDNEDDMDGGTEMRGRVI